MMTKFLPALAACAVTAVLVGAAPANASGQRQDGLQSRDQSITEVSSRHRGYYRGYHARRHWGYYGGPRYRYGYGAYAYDPYYRPYYGPRVHVGPFGFGVGFGRGYW